MGATPQIGVLLALEWECGRFHDVNQAIVVLLGSIRETLAAKCEFKGISLPSAETVAGYRDELAADWSHMLAHQLPSLPRFEDFWSELEFFFAWLGGTAEIAEEPQYKLGHGEEVIRVSQGGFGELGLGSAVRLLETIRFAAANHLCVDLDYRDESGTRSTRRIEPYSLRRTSDGPETGQLCPI